MVNNEVPIFFLVLKNPKTSGHGVTIESVKKYSSYCTVLSICDSTFLFFALQTLRN